MSLSAIVADVVGDVTSVQRNLMISSCICLQLKSLEKSTRITQYEVFFVRILIPDINDSNKTDKNL